MDQKKYSEEEIVRFFQSATEIKQSKEGLYGVLFLTSPQQGQQVIMFTNDPVKHLIPEIILAKMGFIQPNSQVLSEPSPAWKAALDMVDTKLPSPPQEVIDLIENAQKQPIGQEGFYGQIAFFHPQYKAQAQRKILKHILFMDWIKGTSWNHATPDERKAALKNQRVAIDLGRMVIFDSFMGNKDRLNLNFLNAGNLMLCPDGRQVKIGLIDNQCHLNKKWYLSILENFHVLISNKGLDSCKKMAETLMWGKYGAYSTRTAEDKQEQIKLSENLYKGVLDGAQQLVDILSDEKFLQEALIKIPPSDSFDLDLMKSLLTNLRCLIKFNLLNFD